MLWNGSRQQYLEVINYYAIIKVYNYATLKTTVGTVLISTKVGLTHSMDTTHMVQLRKDKAIVAQMSPSSSSYHLSTTNFALVLLHL